jgi:hypothetical protein
LSAVPGAQGLHEPPSVPQARAEGVEQVVPEQHPVEHDVESQTHVPPEQCWPAAHSAVEPQAHVPLPEHPFERVGSHDWHVEASAPHAPTEVGVVQTLPVQHPFAHDVESQTHVPPEQCWPGAHCAPPAHEHVPVDEHPFATVVLQGEQLPPSTPQSVVDGEMHVVPEQHPPGHDVLLQMQAPPTQTCPLAHAEPVVPHVHVPELVHVSALAPHGKHAAPTAAHAVADLGVHVDPEQHPVVHVTLQPAQVPPLHVSADEQLMHPAPPDPQTIWPLPGSHPPWSQHPEQVVPSQTHRPFAQCSPVGQAGPPPHVQAPPAEHPSPVVTPPMTQDWQDDPIVPHAVPVAGDVQAVPPVQHPLAHDEALQTHAPFEHV